MSETPQRGSVWRATAIWAVCTVVGIVLLLVLGPQLAAWHVLPAVASDRAGDIDQVLFLFTLLSIPVFALVIVFAGYSAFTWGSRLRPNAHGRPMAVSSRFQPIWVIISIVLVIFLYVYGLAFLNNVNAAPKGDVLHVNVTGEQWLWDFSYPDSNNVGTSQLELVVNKPVEFSITSIDVQHSFWIPALGIKQDAVPGETTHISATPNTIGTFPIRCAELCGLYHAYMETVVHVVSQDDFNTWIQNQEPSAPVMTPAASSLTPIKVPDMAMISDSRRAAGV
ncbi:MAG: Cytochrome c oxidase polypeptide II [Ktedonobacterales bacterium]|nr:MAG: Cytochrome c oxidase polypeptide II [Ktedonobacterales bacterium]